MTLSFSLSLPQREMPSGVCHPTAEISGEGPAKALLGCLVKTKRTERFEDVASKFQRAGIATRTFQESFLSLKVARI